MTKQERQKVFEKYNGRCAYCGCELFGKWCVDHIVPIYRGDTDEQFERRITHGETKLDIQRGEDKIENMNPACARCNGWKSTFDLETFRREISEQVKRARSYSCNFRMAESFGLVEEIKKPIVFYFETVKLKSNDNNNEVQHG